MEWIIADMNIGHEEMRKDASSLSIMISEKRKLRDLSSEAIQRMISSGQIEEGKLRAKRQLIEKQAIKKAAEKHRLPKRMRLSAAIATMSGSLGGQRTI